MRRSVRNLLLVAIVGCELILMAAGPALRSTPLCHCLERQQRELVASTGQPADSCCACTGLSTCPAANTPTHQIAECDASPCAVRQFLATAIADTLCNQITMGGFVPLDWQAATADPMLTLALLDSHSPRGPPA